MEKKANYPSLTTSFIGLLFAILIYLLFRNINFLYGLFTETNTLWIVRSIRKETFPIRELLADWFLYSLPDGLWAYSYVCLLLYLFKGQIDRARLIWLTAIPFAGVLIELLQLRNLLPGTYDPVDIIFILLGYFIPLFIYLSSKNMILPYHEKTI
jgi:hypothetical protein